MKEAIFNSSATTDGEPGYRERTGETVAVVRPLLVPQEVDEGCGPMYLIRFADGVTAHAFGDELKAI